MREVLDRLREAETALDSRLSEHYFEGEAQSNLRVVHKLWKAKKSIWHALMCVLDAAAGAGKPMSYDDVATALEESMS